MNMYLDPETLVQALAAGQSQEDIAAAMSKALNDAVAIRQTQLAKEQAEKEAKEKVVAVEAAETNLKVAMRDWLKLALPVEVLNALGENAWADLDEVLDHSLSEVKAAMQQAGSLLSLLSQLDTEMEEPRKATPATSRPVRAKVPGTDPASILSAFLENNGL